MRQRWSLQYAQYDQEEANERYQPYHESCNTKPCRQLSVVDNAVDRRPELVRRLLSRLFGELGNQLITLAPQLGPHSESTPHLCPNPCSPIPIS